MSTLLVASTGGHLAQLVRLQPRLRGALDPDVVWVTFDTPQSRSLLAGQDVVFARHTYSRDWRGVIRNSLLGTRIPSERGITGVVSTGAGIALSFIPAARARGLPCHFIESAARAEGPSLTGRLLRRVPGVKLYSQYPEWAAGRWYYGGAVFDAFQAGSGSAPAAIERAVVTLGTIGKYGFRRLVERLLEILPPGAEVLWQTDVTDVRGLGIDARPSLPPDELGQAMREADVVIAHAGIGSALGALEAGRCPLLVPREKRFGEHVDDHQRQIARHLQRRGLAVARAVEDLGAGDLAAAAGRRVSTVEDPPPFLLEA